MYKRTSGSKRLSLGLGIGLGAIGLCIIWIWILVEPRAYDASIWYAFPLISLALCAIGFFAGWGVSTIVYLIYTGLKPGAEDSPDKRLNRQQRTIVWLVAWLLTGLSVLQGVIAGRYWSGYFELRPGSMFWFAILPVFLIGGAAFLHVMRRKR